MRKRSLCECTYAGFFLLLFTAHCTISGVYAAQGQTEILTLDQAVNIALQQNRQVANARLDVEKSDDQISAARKHYLPAFEARFTDSYLLTASDYMFKRGVFGIYPGVGPIPSTDTKISSAQQWNPIFTATVAQPVTQLYKIRLGVDALKVGKNMAAEKLRAQRQAIVSDVKRLYHTILQTRSSLDAAVEAIEFLRELDRSVKGQVAPRVVLESDALEVKARLAKAEYDALTLRNALSIGKQQLNGLLGRDPGVDFTVSTVTGPIPHDPIAADSMGDTLERRADIKGARMKVRQVEYEISIKKAEYIPDVNLIFEYLSPFDSDLLPQNVASVGVQITWDVFDWGRRQSELSERHRAYAQARNDLNEALSQTAIDVQNRINKLKEAKELIRVVEIAREAAREKNRVTMNRYRVQAALLQEVLQSQAAMAEANHRYREAVLAFWTERAEYEKAVGEEP